MSHKNKKTEGNRGKTSPHLERLSLAPKGRQAEETAPENSTWNEKRLMLRKQINAMVGNLETECYKIIFDIFPEKIQLLDDMYKHAPEFNMKQQEVTADVTFEEPSSGTSDEQKRKLQRSAIPCNDNFCKVEELLQKEVLQMSEMINSLGIWVQLNVPRIADGNNFGVEVQQEISAVLDGNEASGYGILDSFAAYHIARGELITKILDYPGIADFRRALKELDEKTYLKTSLIACELRNDYITLYDMLTKNLDTLAAPKGDENEKLARMY